ncbi:replicative DNA helicase [Stenotrophomonas maltophilia]|uniref:replicative DNA helicase n=1 Tax=Stenotrophomonas maltophilia TaxID=40324 RepID=UPI0015E03DCB|nr:replicative DNA helicase [Stenotrophomonas maltophilia]MBA0294372.1 replicative DNA helicase [Stenotrophomonas maltophilia]
MNALPDFYREEGLRMLPQAIEAEQAVLGGLMLRPQAWMDVQDVLTAQQFYRRDHQLIWQAIEDVLKKGREADAVTIGEWFESRGKLELVGDGAYLIELSATTPSSANVRGYAEIVAETAKRRALIDAGQELIDAAYSPEGRSALDLIGSAQTRIGSLLDSEPCDLESVAPVMERVFHRLGERASNEGGISGLTTGDHDLDELLGGLQPGGLYVLAARPKMGKTTKAINVAEHVALRLRKPVAVFTFEMQPEELGDRMLANQAGINGTRIRTGKLDDVDWANASEATRRLSQAPIFVSRPKRARVEHVCAQIRRMHARDPLGLVVIDYLQLMEVKGDNRAAGIGDITRTLKLTASELGVPFLLLSQLNRELEKRTDKRPIVADLRDSGSIEQDADAVIFIYRDEIYNPGSRWEGTAELIVAIQRNGAPGMVRQLYQPEYFRFSPLPEYWQPKQTSASAPAAGTAPRQRRGFAGVAAARQQED